MSCHIDVVASRRLAIIWMNQCCPASSVTYIT